MGRYPRFFVMVSLGYLALGTGMGVLMGAGFLDPAGWRFVHLHMNLLGFLTMIVSGVAYHVIPRFSGRAVKYPGMIAVHFWLANLGLLGMLVTRGLAAGRVTADGLQLFPFFAALAALGAWVFVANLFPILLVRAPIESDVPFGPEMKVSEVLRRWPATLDVFMKHGFAALARPAARATFGKLVSLEKACRIHKVDLPELLRDLNAIIGKKDLPLPVIGGGGAESYKPSYATQACTTDENSGRRSSATQACTSDENSGFSIMRVGELVRRYPATRTVLERYFGPDCFSCPAQLQEPLDQAAALHGVKLSDLLEEVERVMAFSDVRRSGARVR